MNNFDEYHEYIPTNMGFCVSFNPGMISERELTLTFAMCYRPSVRLSVCRL